MASDDFTNTNGTDLDDHDANWTSGANVSQLEIQSNQCEIFGSFNFPRAYYDGSSNNFTELISRGGGDNSGARVDLHIQMAHTVAADNGYRARITGDTTDWTNISLFRDATFLASTGSLSTDPSKGSDVTMKLTGVVNGSDLDLAVFLDGTSELTNTNTSPLTGGFDGFGGYRNGGSAANFKVDDWTSDAPSAGFPNVNGIGTGWTNINGITALTSINGVE